MRRKLRREPPEKLACKRVGRLPEETWRVPPGGLKRVEKVGVQGGKGRRHSGGEWGGGKAVAYQKPSTSEGSSTKGRYLLGLTSFSIFEKKRKGLLLRLSWMKGPVELLPVSRILGGGEPR